MPRKMIASAEKDFDDAMEEARIKVKPLLAVEEVVLSEELAELLRLRNVTWSRIPPLMRKMALPFLTLKETLRLDTAVSERGEEDERDHLIKAYKGLRSPGFDEWVFKGAMTNNRAGLRSVKKDGFVGLIWARERDIDLQNLKLEYNGERDRDQVLGKLVVDKNKDLATYYAMRSEARDAEISARWTKSTTLFEASSIGYLEVVKSILERGADPNRMEYGYTPLCWATRGGHLEIVKVLIAAKAEVNKSTASGFTALYMASENGHLEIVKVLIAAKAEVNKSTASGWTPLARAVTSNYHEIATVLREAGANE